jgi:two-component system, OmpR family, catabolic regulation response regulator CreB
MNNPRVLLLEDDPAIADTVRYALERESFSVTHVTLVRDAERELGKPHDLLLLDIGLPDGNGLDICRAARERNPAWPVLMLTARSEEADRVIGLELGADDYITKPFSPRELVARVRAHLRRANVAAGPGASAQHKPQHDSLFDIDAMGTRIRFCGQLLPLTRREHGLLQLLLQHPGRIYAREMLLDAVWGSDSNSFDRTVDTHIKTLRAKLREVRPDLDPIQTHRGMGYSIDVSGNPLP